jgi:hypothetical protein
MRPDLGYDQFEIIQVLVDQIPGVPGQFSFHAAEEARRSVHTEVSVSAQKNPEQGVKSNKMVHVGMGHKNMTHLEEVSRRKGTQITEIEKKGPPFKKKGDKQPGVRKRIMDESGEECRSHALIL